MGSNEYFKALKKVFEDWRLSFRLKRLPKHVAVLVCVTVVFVVSFFFLRVPDTNDEGNVRAGSIISSRERASLKEKFSLKAACANVNPLPMVHFDSTSELSAYPNASAIARAMPVSARVFTSFFKVYVFDPNSDVVFNLTESDEGRYIDILNARPLMQNALRKLKNNTSFLLSKVSFGYTHMCRMRGLRYVHHVAAISTNRSGDEIKSQHVISIRRHFDGSCRIGVADVSEKAMLQPVYFVVPYANRPNRLKWFLKQFDHLRKRGLNIRLVLAARPESSVDFETAEKLVQLMKFSKNARVIPSAGDSEGRFSRAVAIRDATNFVPDDGLMFISDIDMQIFRPFFENCRMNTIRGHQVYFPVFYTLFAGGKHIERREGYWRTSSYGMSCMYKSDFSRVAAYDNAEADFVGWGEEDIHLVKAFKEHKDYEVFRATEPSLRHKWHVKRCDKNTPSYDSCLTMLYDQLGTGASLGKYLFRKQGIDAQRFLSGMADQDDAIHDGNDKTPKEVDLALPQRLRERTERETG